MNDTRDSTIKKLNELLKGEQMAMQIYSRTKKFQGDGQIFKMLTQFEQDHKKHIAQLSKRINELGGKPKMGTGFAGTMANLSALFNSIRGPKYLLKQLYSGEDKGIHAYEDRIDELDSHSKELIQQIMNEDHEHLKFFKERMEEEKQENKLH